MGLKYEPSSEPLHISAKIWSKCRLIRCLRIEQFLISSTKINGPIKTTVRSSRVGKGAAAGCREDQFPIQEQLLNRNVERFRGGLVFKASRLSYHSTLCWRIIKKKKKTAGGGRTIRRRRERREGSGEARTPALGGCPLVLPPHPQPPLPLLVEKYV